MPRTLTTSAAAHAAGFAVLENRNNRKSQNITNENSEVINEIIEKMDLKSKRHFAIDSLITDFENFYYVLLETYPIMMDESYKDFPLSYSPMSKEWILQEAIGFIKNTTLKPTYYLR